MNRRNKTRVRRARADGFSLVEVLIALLVLGFGLLGYALLQTMALRFTQSANQRTQATTLAYDLLDQMRANRFQASWYSTAGFDAGTVTACGAPPTGTVSVADSIARWQCQVVRTLGPGASANVQFVNGEVVVGVAWNDERWKSSGAITESELRNAFSLRTRL